MDGRGEGGGGGGEKERERENWITSKRLYSCVIVCDIIRNTATIRLQ